MEITEGNRLIAEFLEHESEMQTWRNPENRLCFLINNYWMPVCNLKYHTSWDWLMPVVEKIESLGHSVLIDATMCKIFMDYDYAHAYKDTKLEAVHSAIIKFLDWHNTQTNPIN